MALKRAQLHRTERLTMKVVPVPEWAQDGDSEVMIRVMDGAAMSLYQSWMLSQDAQSQHPDVLLHYVASCIIDPDTQQLVFDTPEAIEILRGKDGRGLKKVFEAATELHLQTAQAAEAFQKNLPPTPADSPGGSTPSSTDTPTPTP